MKQEFAYRPRAYLFGAIIALAATIVCIVLWRTLEHNAATSICLAAAISGVVITLTFVETFVRSRKQIE